MGANAKMNEFSAIMGILNLERMDKVIEARKRCIATYRKLLDDVSGVRFLFGDNENYKVERNYAYCPVLIAGAGANTRNRVYDELKKQGIHARKYFYPLTADQVCFKNKYRSVDIPIAREMAEHVLVLPLYEELQEIDIERICSIIRGAI